ncbi:HD-GYP domain-containing protein [Phorcysia thermohydrogeniphila]|uniref:Putative nucleotidyltransferase with HDIG domain n=1 Tax=Phorcysia thermohydrogeniphila TaxID=936138 RepID=A0A4R1GBU6_9BACT|nr:HD domain-containing phosphohydrolase [Phorcysia thermohydrogeniphila]TCK05268.1 putative nucleotidyltransferase with HDIG domain [Phorcysia thermohydrogeniphila]
MNSSIDISKFLLAVSSMSGLVDPILNNHNYRVAFISYSIAREISFSSDFLYNILVSGLLHDIGLLLVSTQEDIAFVKAVELERDKRRMHLHAEIGYELLRHFPYFSKIAKIIRYHHYSCHEIVRIKAPFSSLILHLADRIDTVIYGRIEKLGRENPYASISSIRTLIEEYLLKFSGRVFNPKLVEIFLTKISPKDSFWFELLNENCLKESLEELLRSFSQKLPFEAFYDLSKMLAYLIDFKSPFTATHSSGVAQTALSLATLFNFTSPDLKKIEVAGLLHDIGKIAVPKEILEKPGRLTPEEYSIMKSHVFFSYRIISKLAIDTNIVEWAAYHHETLDGSGYPFRLNANDLSLGSRIMAVADVFTALMEDRPYKKGLSGKETVAIIEKMVEEGKLDRTVVNVLKKNLKKVDSHRKKAQERAKELYLSLRNLASDFISS